MKFTEHVRNPNPEGFNLVIEALAVVLRNRMRKKGVFRLPPAYLDYPHHSSWNDTEALKDIVYDFYGYCFVQKRRSLLGALDKKADIEGLVVCNVDHFLFMRQSKRDSYGYNSFKNCKGSLLTLESLGVVVQEKGVSGKTFRIAGKEGNPSGDHPEPKIADFVCKYPGWGLGAHDVARKSKEGADFVSRLIIEFFAAGGMGFRFEDLVLAVKDKVKSCLKVQSFDEEIHSNRNAVEHAGQTALGELFDLDCVRGKIAGSRNSSTRVDLSAMLQSLMDEYRQGGDFNLAEMANKMGLPTSTHHDQWTRLRGFFQDCARSQIRMIGKQQG